MKWTVTVLCAWAIWATPLAFGGGDSKFIVTFTQEKSQKLLPPSSEPFWTPSDKAISLLESKIQNFMATHPPKFHPKAINLLDYGRQYFGTTSGGHKVILTKAACLSFLQGESGKHWRKELIPVKGGGSCFFSVEFNPTNEEFSNLTYNADK